MSTVAYSIKLSLVELCWPKRTHSLVWRLPATQIFPMAPTRKSRSVNKRFSYPNEVSPARAADGGNKSSQRKRKLPDMLGIQWGKEELQRFYEAYRKYGKDWKKVASAVRNRTVEMVEALYTMNRAYLSLPEGTASVVGLIAMMTDHYSVLGGSDSEQESNDGVGTSRKPQKHGRAALRSGTNRGSDAHFPDISQSQTAASSYGCLSMLKKRRSGSGQSRAVGKRTPRFPVKYTHNKDIRDKYLLPVRQGSKMKADTLDDDVAQEVALALAEASHRGGSPQLSRTPNKRRENAVSSSAGYGERMYSESGMTNTKDIENETDEYGREGSSGSMEADTGDFPRERSYLGGSRGADIVVAQWKGKKLYGKKLEALGVGHHHVDDTKEACSKTEGQKIGALKRKAGVEVADTTAVCLTSPKKRSKKVLFGRDEGSAFDALQTLADLSLMMPASTTETEPTIPLEEEKITATDNSRVSEAVVAATYHREKSKVSVMKKKGDQSVVGAQLSESKAAKPGKARAAPEANHTGAKKRKQKSPTSKILSDVHMDSDTNEILKKEFSDQGKKSTSRSKRSSLPQLGQLVRTAENSSSSADLRREGDELAVPSILAPVKDQASLPTKVKRRRKMEKAQNLRNSHELKIFEAFANDQSNMSKHSSCHEALGLKLQERLSNCLSNDHVRRWCVFEWCYSAIDYPWFAKSEFVEYLYHVGLGHVPRLTRVEWGVIRSSLGKPRRFSEQFLKEEKEKLNHYRESVRNHYTELRTGTREGVPTDLARPLTVGQRVIALHPWTREAHNGSVLTVDRDRCRVQFDRPELGVEFVMDIDCMPLNPSENMPASLKRHTNTVDKFYDSLKQLKANETSEDIKKEQSTKVSPSQKAESANGPSYVVQTYPLSNSLKQGKEGLTSPSSQVKVGHDEVVSPEQRLTSHPPVLSHIQAKEADIRALAELSHALDKKNALVTELKRLNDDVTEDSSLKDMDSFKKQYAAVLVQLDEIFEQVSSALLCLRQRNTCHGSSPYTWHKPMTRQSDRGSLPVSFDRPTYDSQDSGPYVSEIFETSRVKAQKMVDAAMQAISSMKVGQNCTTKIEDAIDYVNNHLSVDDSSMLAAVSQVKKSLAPRSQHTSCESNLVATDHALDIKTNGESYGCEPEIPSELISNCVAILLMIQKCTERQCPPADVAQILDFAVSSLQPCCSQNIPVYVEIQKCMGIIRSQILALVPT
ncbi:hypothetical protein Nepgr_021880 [Nepenthes gracilis]|uniref:SANT domain-containing protein n=1 Tax=Nepenthes gracilis TaxID=150966 RepID=A0AAD3XXH4_NEPGR|nr:hypothetical protein Nepgr_021880 [Nepenthes gracilis]